MFTASQKTVPHPKTAEQASVLTERKTYPRDIIRSRASQRGAPVGKKGLIMMSKMLLWNTASAKTHRVPVAMTASEAKPCGKAKNVMLVVNTSVQQLSRPARG